MINVELCKIYFVEKRKFIDYHKKGFDILNSKGVLKMKISEMIYKKESLKAMINYKDIFYFLISLLGLVIANIQLIEISKLLSSNNFTYKYLLLCK